MKINPKITHKKGAKNSLKSSWKNFILYGFLALFLVFLTLAVSDIPYNQADKVPLSKVIEDVKNGKVESLEVAENKVEVIYKNSEERISFKEENTSIYEVLKDSGVDPKQVKINVEDQTGTRAWVGLLSSVLPVLILVGVFYFIFRQARGAQESIFSFGSSRAKTFNKDFPKTTFNDVAGVDEAKQELSEVVDFLKNPEKYHAMGARIPKGVLLVGPSGTGKTLMARAVAGEAKVPFFSIAGSEFMEMLVGVGAARVRDLFNTAKKSQPAIIFIDEVDAIGRQRGIGIMGGHDEREQTLNQILVEMDGFTPTEQLVIVAASVTGDTPIMIRKNGKVSIVPIGTFIDAYYDEREEGLEKEVDNVETLGFEKKDTSTGKLLFKRPAFKRVRSVFRHRVKEIYEIEYLGGKINATGNHSVFIRRGNSLLTRPVSELKKGDILVDLPYKYIRSKQRAAYIEQEKEFAQTLLVYIETEAQKSAMKKYIYAMEQGGMLSQEQTAYAIGVSQLTISHWQRQDRLPRAISRAYFKHELPEEISVTKELCRLMGYYVAEGYARKEVDFCFNAKETNLIKDVVQLMQLIFNLKPYKIKARGNAINIVYYSRPLALFFSYHSGKGAHNKHVPTFLFEAPKEYFIEFLKGVFEGDGYEDKRGRGEITSVSKQLIMELNWLSRMHGFKTYMHSFTAKEGRSINGGKPLQGVVAYRLGWGKMANPFGDTRTNFAKLPRVLNVRKVQYDGYVYDLCGCDNEAFFGGESPILLHNTNRPDILDPALVRPGRFDRRIALQLPDIEGRKEILAIHSKNKPFEKNIDWERAARRTVGFSGADLENMLNEAAILAARLEKKVIDMSDIEEAATKVKLGPEKKRLQSDEDRKITAYHEGGHAIVSYFMPHMDPVHRISIVGRGLSLGHTLIPPAQDRVHETKTRLLEQISTMLGGRAAEELIFREMTTGASDDIEKATQLVRMMVVEFGMSRLGPVSFDSEKKQMLFETSQISDEMKSKIDSEIKRIIDESYEKAAQIIKKNKHKLDEVATRLLQKETIDGEEFEQIIKGEGKQEKVASTN